jgi:diacylglycerol kinase (ATP)
MLADKPFLFIVNPISGGRKKLHTVRKIEQIAAKYGLNFRIEVPENALITRQLALEAVTQNFFSVVACGGDGTVNDVASQLVNTETTLGIIPMGSGNGLAREMGVPFDLELAVKTLAEHTDIIRIDTGRVNEHFFLNIAGVGFDAHVARMFSSSKRRGLGEYVRIILCEFFKYPENSCALTIDNQELELTGLVLAVCNGKQFGNNFIIAKNAQTDDGRFELVSVRKPHWYEIPKLFWALQRGQEINTLQFFNCRNSFTIQRANDGFVNIDGEPVAMNKKLEVKILPQSLKIILGKARN